MTKHELEQLIRGIVQESLQKVTEESKGYDLNTNGGKIASLISNPDGSYFFKDENISDNIIECTDDVLKFNYEIDMFDTDDSYDEYRNFLIDNKIPGKPAYSKSDVGLSPKDIQKKLDKKIATKVKLDKHSNTKYPVILSGNAKFVKYYPSDNTQYEMTTYKFEITLNVGFN